VLEDDVEVGANAAVDRAALGATVVGRGTKIDNLVTVAHGCRIGPECLLAAQAGLAGSTTLGTRVMLGGQVGLAGHQTVGDGAQVAAKSGVHGDVPAGAVYGGYPATEVRVWRRASAALLRRPEVLRRLRRMERALGLGEEPTGEEWRRGGGGGGGRPPRCSGSPRCSAACAAWSGRSASGRSRPARNDEGLTRRSPIATVLGLLVCP